MVSAYPRKLLEFESREIGEGVHLEIAPERFDGIELRSIRRQQEYMESPRGVDELLRDTASMGLGAIPDENDVPWNLILEMPEELANEIAGDVIPWPEGRALVRAAAAESPGFHRVS